MLKRFWSYYRPYQRLFVLDFSCAVILAILELSFPLFVNYVVDKLLPGNNWSLILAACAAMLAVYTVNAVLQFIVNYWGHMLGINIETDLRGKLFDHIQKLSFRFFDNIKTGHLMSRMSTDLFDIGEMAHHGPEDVFIATMTLLGAFAIMLFVHWKLALLTFVAVPILIWLAIICNQRMTKAIRKMYSDIADYNARVEDNLGGIRVVQAFANEEHEKRLFAASNRNFRRSKLSAYKIMSWSLSISYFLMRLVTLFILLCGAWYVFHEKLTAGEFFAFLLLANVLFRPIEKINAVIELYPKGLAGFTRYCDVSSGRITIDGQDIRDLTLSSLRRQIGIVQQDVFLFGGTLRENIVYGNLVASEGQIWDAARRAHLEDFIFRLERGLDTVIGERGVKLSGGQKQRLAIARMFLKNPPILILDEATSALDSETEAVIQRSLAELSDGRTTLLIAHRLATTKNADRIIVVTEEGIAEEGRHEELLAFGGVFARLYQAQFG